MKRISKAAVAVIAATVPLAVAPAASAASHRYMVSAKPGASLAAVKAAAERSGLHVLHTVKDVHMLVVRGTRHEQARLAGVRGVAGVARDRIVQIAPPEGAAGADAARARLQAAVAAARAAGADPANGLPGLFWDFNRIGAQRAWRVTTGSRHVLVAVEDTGVDYTHKELRGQVVRVKDFADTGEPNVCRVLFGVGDRHFAREFGVPVNQDFNGHGSWIAGDIAARMDGRGMNGIAPGVKLASLKIGGWCGYSWNSDQIRAFVWAANHNVDVVNISFGGYDDLSTRDGRLDYRMNERAVRYARRQGTLIVSSAGNDHVRLGRGGRVLTHGILTAPGTGDLTDYYGWYEVPAGVRGAVAVSATGNLVNAPSAHCPASALEPVGYETCKPASDAHQAAGVGRQNQLSYYSNYGPRIDVAAPGGARKFNLPVWDRGGTPGFPFTSADGTNVWQNFSITSNYAQQIPCAFLPAPFYANQCYSAIQGTSMAAPHAAASLALIASAFPAWRHHPAKLLARLKATTTHPNNATRALSAGDHSPGEVAGYDVPCTTGDCHLGGHRISNADAYGAGLVNVGRAVR